MCRDVGSQLTADGPVPQRRSGGGGGVSGWGGVGVIV